MWQVYYSHGIRHSHRSAKLVNSYCHQPHAQRSRSPNPECQQLTIGCQQSNILCLLVRLYDDIDPKVHAYTSAPGQCFLAVFGRLRISVLVSLTVPPAGVRIHSPTLGESVRKMQGQRRVNAPCNAKGKDPAPLADAVRCSRGSRQGRTDCPLYLDPTVLASQLPSGCLPEVENVIGNEAAGGSPSARTAVMRPSPVGSTWAADWRRETR